MTGYEIVEFLIEVRESFSVFSCHKESFAEEQVRRRKIPRRVVSAERAEGKGLANARGRSKAIVQSLKYLGDKAQRRRTRKTRVRL